MARRVGVTLRPEEGEQLIATQRSITGDRKARENREPHSRLYECVLIASERETVERLQPKHGVALSPH
jgi:hypothetical protein